MFQSRDRYGEAQAANLMITGLLCLFAFVVLFVFISFRPEMLARSDVATTRGDETTGSSTAR